jgi:phage/plasmid-like protein (TIGR03299 family)
MPLHPNRTTRRNVMGHEMTSSDQMYSVRDAPWHLGRGTNVLMLDTAPETRMARIDAAGHAFAVEEHDVYVRTEDAEARERFETFPKINGWKALIRSDTTDVLHVARGSYEVVQNIVGHELFEALSHGARLDDGTGGTVKGGAVCYLSAQVDEPHQVIGDDSPIYPYVVVLWTHDGSGALQARRTSVRPVCWNTISLGEAEARRSGRNFTFRHTKNVLARIEEAKRVIAGAREETAAFVELANELAGIPVTDDQRERFVTAFIPRPEAQVISDQVLDNILRERSKVRAIFDGPTITETHRNTAYGLVQAGVEYLDHLRAYRNGDTYLGRTLLRDEPLKRKLVPMVRELVASPRAA